LPVVDPIGGLDIFLPGVFSKGIDEIIKFVGSTAIAGLNRTQRRRRPGVGS